MGIEQVARFLTGGGAPGLSLNGPMPGAGLLFPQTDPFGVGMGIGNPLLGGSLNPDGGLFGDLSMEELLVVFLLLLGGNNSPLDQYPQLNQAPPADNQAPPPPPERNAPPPPPPPRPQATLQLPEKTRFENGAILLSEAAIKEIAANPGKAREIVQREVENTAGEKEDWKILSKIFRPDNPFTHGGKTKSGKKFSDIYNTVLNQATDQAVKLADYYNKYVKPQGQPPQGQPQGQPPQGQPPQDGAG